MTELQERIRQADEALKDGRTDEAEAVLAQVLDSPDLPPGDRGQALSGRGLLRFHQWRHDDAVADFTEAGRLLAETYGPAASVTLTARMFLARALVSRGDTAEGCKLGHEVLTGMDEALPADSPLLAEACFLLSQGEYELRDLEAAEALTRRALSIWEKIYGPESFNVSTCLNNLGRIYEERGLLDEGIGFHRRSAAMRKKILGDHAETAFCLGNLGTALAMNGEWAEAAKVLEECVATYERSGIHGGAQMEGYRQNLDVCRQALADPEGEAFKQ